MAAQVKAADVGNDPFAQLASLSQDKRFLGQLQVTKTAFDKGDWRGVTLSCRMLYRIALDNDILKQVEPILRPIFDAAASKFEESRRVAKALRARIMIASRKVKQISRLAILLRRIV